MIEALLLILSPFATWEKIVKAKHSLVRILCLSLLPLMLLSSGAEAYSLTRRDGSGREVSRQKPVSQEIAIRYAAIQVGVGLLMLFIAAKFVQALGDSFRVNRSYTACFTLAGYGLTPAFLMHFVDALPFLSTWLCWAAGAVLCVYVLYHGIGLVLEPDQTNGFSLYLVSSITLVFISGLGHLATYAVLHRKLLG